MKSLTTIIVFIIINFLALAIGGFYTGDGVSSDWYQELNKAPWTPPGWVFGAAWTLVMICFGFYMSQLFKRSKRKSVLILLFLVQWVLNVLWNPVFFYFRDVEIGLILIVSLTALVALFLIKYARLMNKNSFLIMPYLIWLFIATSLNLYIYLYN